MCIYIDTSETRIKTEEETATSSCSVSGGVSKDCAHPLAKNGATNVIGSTNTGSVHNLIDRKDPLLLDNVPEEGRVFLKLNFHRIIF